MSTQKRCKSVNSVCVRSDAQCEKKCTEKAMECSVEMAAATVAAVECPAARVSAVLRLTGRSPSPPCLKLKAVVDAAALGR